MSPVIPLLLVLAMGLVGWLVARGRARALRRSAGRLRMHSLPGYHAWFVALAPIEKPRFAVAVLIEDGGEGSGIGASLAGQILRAAFTDMPVVTPAP